MIGYKKRKPCEIKDTSLKNKDMKIRYITVVTHFYELCNINTSN